MIFPARHLARVFLATAITCVPTASLATYEAQLNMPSDTDTLLCFHFPTGTTQARTIVVGPGSSIQAAIEMAQEGDLISVAVGTYEEDIDFLGKAVRVLGSGPETIIRGTGTGPVVTFANGESPNSVLDSFTITGGRAELGGGIYIAGSSPTIVRSVVTDNRASRRGSGIYIEEAAAPRLYNNLVSDNRNDNGDPHGIQIRNASPIIVNNTIAHHDSNGILISGVSAPVIMNNIIAYNGATVRREVRGRGICDFSGNQATIRYNNFWRNRIAALLRGGRDWRFIESFQNRNNDPNIANNVDGLPRFARSPRRPAERNPPDIFLVRDSPRSHALNNGDPDPACNNLDGTRNTMGFTGGPFAPGSSGIPGPGGCGIP